MRIMTYISYFSISLVLQVVWLLLIKRTSNIFLIDMITVSFLFTLFMFILDQMFKKADKLGTVFNNPRASLSF